MPMESARREQLVNLVLTVLILAAVVEVGLLIRQNRSLRAQIESLSAAVAAHAGSGGPAIGSKALPLNIIDTGGSASRLEFDQVGRPTLVIIASAECPACTDSLPQWRKALDEAGEGRVRLLALTMGDPIPMQEKLEKAGLSLPTYKVVPEEGAESWRMSMVPLTVLVDTSGTVSQVWAGALSDETTAALAKALRDAQVT